MRQSDNNTRKNKKKIAGNVTREILKKVHETKKILRENNVSTVCEKAKCPNITKCFMKPTATFIILGKACTRSCAFCAVNHAAPIQIDENEPQKIASAVEQLKLKHVVITSVTRDDLDDRGISQFVNTVRAIKSRSPDVTVEVLTPDFRDRIADISLLFDEDLDIFGHNIEMTERLYSAYRCGADYRQSLELLREVAELNNYYSNKKHYVEFLRYNIRNISGYEVKPPKKVKIKSAIMLGLGETKDEVKKLLKDIRDTGCEIIVIGQYLQPTVDNVPVKEFISAEEFKFYEKYSYSLGFSKVYSFPEARSSYAL